jgi:N-methylhydantoinase B
VRADGREEACPAKFLTTVNAGDLLKVRLSGGGGHGNPLDRDPAAVLADVVEQKMSIAHAREAYAVVIAGTQPAVDEPATRALRKSRGVP